MILAHPNILLAELLDRIIPYEVEYATSDGRKLEMWDSEPIKSDGEWIVPDGRMPMPKFYIPEKRMILEDGEKYKIKGTNATKEE